MTRDLPTGLLPGDAANSSMSFQPCSMRWTSSFRGTGSSSIAPRTSASSPGKGDRLWPFRPNLRGCGDRSRSAQKASLPRIRAVRFRRADRQCRRLLRSLSCADGGDAAIRAHPEPGARTLPGGPINVDDQRTLPPPKTTVLTKMEELIHHFIIHTEGSMLLPARSILARKIQKGELGFYINSRGGGTPHRLKIRGPSFVNLSILPRSCPVI